MNPSFLPFDNYTINSLVTSSKKKIKEIKGRKANYKTEYGLEFTYALKLSIKEFNKLGYDKYIKLITNLEHKVSNNIKINNSLICNIYNDDGCIEIVTIPTTKLKLIKTFNNINLNIKEEYNLQPSSLSGLEDEGGCHISIDRDDDLYEKLKNYIISNPYICWYFLSPYDNESSTIFNINDCIYSYYKFIRKFIFRIELRFFMMPRNTNELQVHLDFTENLVNYCHKQTMIIDENETDKKLSKLNKITQEESIIRMKKVCEEIGFDYNRLIFKEKILKMRYRLGKKYLN